MSSLEDIELIIKAKAQDQTAYNLLFNKYWNAVFSFLNQRTSNPNLAEELAIETFAKAFDQLDRYDETLSFATWLFTIAKNHQIDRYRKSKKRVENHLELDDSIPIDLPTYNPSPEELLIATENMDHILEHIQSMKEEYRNLIRMRYFENLSLREIEALLQEPATTIRVKLFRAKKMLANLLHKDEI